MILTVISLAIIFCTASSNTINLTLLQDKNAKCLDGSLSGYYYEPSSKVEDGTKWAIYLQGGGECDNEAACKYQLTTSLGSSKYFPQSYEGSSSWYLASGYCPYNPEFCGWNHVNVPYCSQDLHTGQVTEASNSTWGLYFAGHLILAAVLDELAAKYNFNGATEIILLGVSAGGIGVWPNVDYIKERVPKARVTAATIAGFYFDATFYEGTNHTTNSLADFRAAAWPSTYELYDAFVDQSCKAAFEAAGKHPGACMLSNNSYPFISADAFVVQAQTDQTVLTGHDQFPDEYKLLAEEQQFMDAFRFNMSVGLKPLMEPSRRSGVFSAACYIHGGFTHSYPLINGFSYQKAFANFYFDTENKSPEAYKLEDTCGLMCNPTCYAA